MKQYTSGGFNAVIYLAFALIVAIWLGVSIVTTQAETLIKVVIAVILLVCFLMGKKIWLLIPFGSAIALSLRIPGQPDALLACQILAISFCLIIFLLRRLPYEIIFTELECWIVILILCVLQVYVRNPVGISVFGSSTVGGKPYLLFATALASAFLLLTIKVSHEELNKITKIYILGGFLNLILSLLGLVIPSLGYYLGVTYTRSDQVDYTNAHIAVDRGAATRVGYLSYFANNLSLWISSYKSPLNACLHPLWCLIVIFSGAAAMASGYRNGVVTVGLTYFIAIAYRNGWLGIIVSTLMGTAFLVSVALLNLVAPLPPNVQRALTFLPGTWDQRYEDDAHGSTEWRVEIWKEALTSEKWIKNKLMGDGLGFSAAELAAQKNLLVGNRPGVSGFDSHRETILANGDYHSGPVSMIRTIGYVGLILFIVAQIRTAIHAHRLIRYFRKTKWENLVFMVGIPIIWTPIYFLFIFGDFKASMGTLLMAIGMIRLLEKNLPKHDSQEYLAQV